jgi:hypothetical protein
MRNCVEESRGPQVKLAVACNLQPRELCTHDLFARAGACCRATAGVHTVVITKAICMVNYLYLHMHT